MIDIPSEGGQADIQWDDGSSAKINPSKLPKVSVRLDDTLIPVELSKATRIEIEPSATDVQISYILIVKSQGKEIDRRSVDGILKLRAVDRNPMPTTQPAPVIRDSPPLPINEPSLEAAIASDVKTDWDSMLDYQASGAKFTGQTKAVNFAGKITDVTVAGGGRFMLLVLGNEKRLVVFDIAKAAVETVLPLSSSTPLVAGTMEHIVVIDPSRNVLEKYSIDGFSRVSTSKFPTNGVVKAIAAGYASKGPLFVVVAQSTHIGEQTHCDYALFENEKLTTIPFDPSLPRPLLRCDLDDNVKVRASANGRVFGTWKHLDSTRGLQVAALAKGYVHFAFKETDDRYGVPSADGFHFSTFSKGMLKTAGAIERGRLKPQLTCFPTTHPRFYVSIPPLQRTPNSNGPKYETTLCEVGTNTPIAKLPEIEFGELPNDVNVASMNPDFDKRIFIHLGLNAIVSIPLSNDRIVVQPFNLLEELKGSESDYFVVVSVPTPVFSPGKTYQYQIRTLSANPQIKYKLIEAPGGMSISESGRLIWKVPKNFSNPDKKSSFPFRETMEIRPTNRLRSITRSIRPSSKFHLSTKPYAIDSENCFLQPYSNARPCVDSSLGNLDRAGPGTQCRRVGKTCLGSRRSDGQSTFATAFCIDQDGLFVTNFHVVDNLQPGEPIKLILNANEQNEFALQAKVVHVDQKNDLALLKVQDIPKDRALEALPLASDPKLFETMDVLALAFHSESVYRPSKRPIRRSPSMLERSPRFESNKEK